MSAHFSRSPLFTPPGLLNPRLRHPLFLYLAALIFAVLLALLLALFAMPSSVRGQSRTILPLITGGTEAAFVPDAPQVQEQTGKLLLPLVSGGDLQITKEEYKVRYDQESTIVAFGGRVTIHIPQEAVPYFNNTLTVMSPNPQAAWLEVYITIINNQGSTYPIYVTELFKPITIAFDYSKVDLTYLDETRLTVVGTPSYDWLPEIASETSHVETASPQADSVWQVSVNVAERRVILSANRAFIVPRVAVGYSISDMAIGPGGKVYAAAAPVIYTVGDNGTLARVVNVDEVPGAADLHTSFGHFAVNTKSGEIYLALRGKAVGAPLKVYALKGSTLRELYTVPDGEAAWAMAYRPQDNALYLTTSKIVNMWLGIPTYDNWIRAIDADSGTMLGAVNPDKNTIDGEGAYTHPIAALTVDSTGHVLATISTEGYPPVGYSPTKLFTGNAPDLLPRFYVYPGFHDASYLASDSHGRTFIANGGGNVISVVAGAPSELVGYLAVDNPGPLAISGSSLYVVSNGRITKLAIDNITRGGNEVEILAQSLHGIPNIRVAAAAFSPILAHNVLYYNGVRFFTIGNENLAFTSMETELTYFVKVPQPDPVVYKPLTDQHATVTFKMNGTQVAEKTIAAPETPYQRWDTFQIEKQANINVVQHRWLLLSYEGALSSQEGLFPDIPATLTQGTRNVFVQFNELGVFHFTIKIDYPLQEDKVINFTVTVGIYGDYDTQVKTIDPATGGVLWVGGAAFDIPAGALPAHAGGYTITFTSQANELVLKDAVSERSPIYTFFFEPEVLHLNQALFLHLPRSGDEQIMAFYDPLIDDAYTIPAMPEPPMHLLVTLPAGDYASEATDETTDTGTSAAQAMQPQATEFDWIPYPTRLALNWLGKTGLWHLVGLPNDKIVTDHFVILYNTKDCTPAYAGILLDALEDAYIHFSAQSAYMPATAVYVKIAPWIATKSTPGVTPGVGSLFHYYMFINNSLSTEALQDTAVHEFMHVLQKTNASPGGRYVNPLWWEEATAIWAQYSLYPEHKTYLSDFESEGERWLRNPYSGWNGMSTAEMYAAMSLAEYLVQQYGNAAVFNTFQLMGLELDNEIDVAEAIEKVTKKDFGDFYEEFAKEYWLQRFEPVKSWTFLDNITGADANKNAILRIGINQPVNTIFNAYIPDLSSGLYKIHAIDPLPVSFTRDSGSTTGSIARIARSCTGNLFYFYDSSFNAIPHLNFVGEVLPGLDEILYDKNLGNLTLSKPLYMLYIDRSYNYPSICSPTVTLEQPTISSIYPSNVAKNTTPSITITGQGFGPVQGTVSVAFSTLPAASITSWSPTSITFTWNAGTVTGTVTVQVYTKRAARSNGMTLTITP